MKKRNYISKNCVFFVLLIILATVMLGVGYAQISGVTLDLTGTVTAFGQDGVVISDVQYLSSNNADSTLSEINTYYQTLLDSKIVLNSDVSSTITYKIDIINLTDGAAQFAGVVFDSAFYDNVNITYELDGLSVKDVIESGKTKTFNITFKYAGDDISNNILNSCINFKFNVDITCYGNKIVTFNNDGVESEVTVECGNLVDRPAAPSKLGYTFIGWYDRYNNEFDFTTPITDDITLKAKYEQEQKAMLGTAWAVRNVMKTYFNFSDVLAIKQAPEKDETANAFRVDRVQLPNDSFGYSNYTDYNTEIWMWFDSGTGILYWYSHDSNPSFVPDGGYDSNASNYFQDFTSLTDISGVKPFDISKSTSLFAMFKGCSSLTDLTPISNWDISNVTNLKFMFQNCSSLTTPVAISTWDTSKVVDIISTFNGTGIEDATSLASWDISNISESLEGGKGGATGVFWNTPISRDTSGTNQTRIPYDNWLSQKPGWRWVDNNSSFQTLK